MIVNYSVELCSNRTGRCEYFNTGSDDTFYDLQGETLSEYIHTCMCAECRGFESHLRQIIFLATSDCLGRVVCFKYVSGSK